jgi:uncharacterized membrane protein YhaH (DUF805 family)
LERVRRLFQFSGRAGRREYWLLAIPITVALWGSPFLFLAAEGDLVAQAFFILGVLPVLGVANIALGTRRLHDRGRSGWWLLLYYGVPTATMFPLGAMGDDASVWFAVPLLLPLVAAIVDLGILRGAEGPNRYSVGKASLDASMFD